MYEPIFPPGILIDALQDRVGVKETGAVRPAKSVKIKLPLSPRDSTKDN